MLSHFLTNALEMIIVWLHPDGFNIYWISKLELKTDTNQTTHLEAGRA